MKHEDNSRTTSLCDVANQLTRATDSSGITTYTFDSNGNQQIVLALDASRTTNTWYYETQRTLVQLSDGSRVTATRNADNRRGDKET